MRKIFVTGFCMTIASICIVACGNSTEQEQETAIENTQEESVATEIPDESDEIEDTEEVESVGQQADNKVLVAYFTRLPNTESGDDLDAVVQGGGPYGEIGDSYATADMDAISSASVTVVGDEAKGNVEAVAEWIAEDTNGDLFSIETAEKYPLDYDAVIDQGGVEQREGDRPELSTHVDNMEDYSVIYLGYPNWYNDMPMAVYSFLEEYDLQGKTIIPFCTSASSGLANTVASIAELQPQATVVDNGLSLIMYDVKNSQEEVTNWVNSVGVEP